MRFSSTTTASILFSLIALEVVGAPAPQYDTTIIVSTTVDAAAGSASDSPVSSAATSAKACKAKPAFAQAWRQHRRPRPSAAGSGNAAPPAPAPSQEVPSSGNDTPSGVPASSYVPITSLVDTEPTPVESQMPSVVETAPVVTATAIGAGGDSEVIQNPPSQVAQPSAIESSFTFESSSSSSSEWSTSSSWTSSAQPAASASPEGNGAPAGFEADILQAHNEFRATWGAGALVWNQTLADMGNEYYSSKNCDMKHSNMQPGENLAGGSGSGPTVTAMGGAAVLKMWGDEAKDWPVGTLDPASLKDENGEELVTGHFTQVVWKETTSLGCGEFTCGNTWLAFCEYWPRGNMGGDYGPENGKPGQVGSPQ